jgi:hypothetical protein
MLISESACLHHFAASFGFQQTSDEQLPLTRPVVISPFYCVMGAAMSSIQAKQLSARSMSLAGAHMLRL